MESGNIPEKFTIELDYISSDTSPFSQETSERRIIFHPHQTKSILKYNDSYQPIKFTGSIYKINCTCLNNNFNIIDNIINKKSLQDTLLWIDPRALPTICFASIIYNWLYSINPHKNISLGIIAPKNESKCKNDKFLLWKSSLSGAIEKSKPKYSVWYPSLARNNQSLLKASKYLDPYDVYPLLDFSKIIVETGENELTNHSDMLENTRTRTRHFIYLNSSNPKRSFQKLYNTFKAMPRSGPLTIHPTLTPGGLTVNFLITLLAGVLSESYFLTPSNEIPIDANEEIEGIIVLRKCV